SRIERARDAPAEAQMAMEAAQGTLADAAHARGTTHEAWCRALRGQGGVAASCRRGRRRRRLVQLPAGSCQTEKVSPTRGPLFAAPQSDRAGPYESLELLSAARRGGRTL